MASVTIRHGVLYAYFKTFQPCFVNRVKHFPDVAPYNLGSVHLLFLCCLKHVWIGREKATFCVFFWRNMTFCGKYYTNDLQICTLSFRIHFFSRSQSETSLIFPIFSISQKILYAWTFNLFKNRNCAQQPKFRLKLEIYLRNRSFVKKSEFSSRIEIPLKNWN